MRLPEICIKRPVFATVMSIVLILVGLVCYNRLVVREYPKIERPILSISTNYPGANPEIIESTVTKILEEEFAKVEGVDIISSVSQDESSHITIQFRVDRPLDAAAGDIRDRLNRLKRRLPYEAQDSVIKKSTADEKPILFVALSSDTRSAEDIADYAKRYLETEFETLDGVASANVNGGGDYQMHIWLDPIKMAAYDLTAYEVFTSIKRHNVEKPAGRITAGDREYMVSTFASLTTPNQFDQLIVGTDKKEGYVRLADIGRAEFSASDKVFKILYNGKNAVAITIVSQSTANPLEVVKQIRKKIPELAKQLPADLKMEIAIDQTEVIKYSINEVYETIAIATFLVLIVIFAFLGTLRASLIPLVTIPVSLIGACSLLYAWGFSINVLTLLSLVLAIGLVVDDAIVVLENIYRHIEDGLSPMEASLKGSKEISFAVVAMTITLAAVYAPIALSQGMTGKLFTEFALTLAGSVIISGFVALTLSPMMCSKLLKPHNPNHLVVETWKNKWLHQIDAYLKKLDGLYEKALTKSMDIKKWVIAFALGISAIGYVLGAFFLTKELAPQEDRGLLQIRAQAPTGSTIGYISKYMDTIDNELDRIPEIKSRLIITETPTGKGFAVLNDWSKRSRSASKIAEATRSRFEMIAGVQGKIFAPSSPLGGGSGDDRLQFLVLTSKSYTELKLMTERLMGALRKTDFVKDVVAELGTDAREYVVSINRDKASALKIEVATIAETLDILGKGQIASKIKKDSKEYDVKVEVEEKYRRKPQDLTDIYVKGDRGVMVPLADLITVEPRSAAFQINHFQRLRSITLYGNLAGGYSLGEVIDKIQDVAKTVLPENSKIDWEGETRRYLQEQSSMYLIFGLALAFIYLVLAAQFESFKDPFVIMFSVPLSIVGALITLKITGGSLNLFSQIGLVTLIGLITKHGILIVDFANKLVEEGHDRTHAVIEASKKRLRPILMTTAAMVLGAVPLALANGAGAELRQQIGWVIVGGMSFGTLFTLFIVPVMYTYLDSKPPRGFFKRCLKRIFEKKEKQAA